MPEIREQLPERPATGRGRPGGEWRTSLTISDFEKPKKLLVLPGTPQDYPELLTPPLKIKRTALLAAHGAAVAGLFLPK